MVRTRMARITAGAAAASLLAWQLVSGVGWAGVPAATVAAEATPPSYSAGNLAGFRASFVLNGNNLSKLFLTIESSGAAGVAFLSTTKNGGTVNACSTGLPVSCSFGGQKKHDRIDVLVGLTPASSASSVSARFVWSSSGNTPSDGGSSHGDFWIAGPVAATFSANPNFGGGFLAAAGGTVSNSQTLSSSNKQAATLQNLPGTVAATVLDGPSVAFPCSDVSNASVASAGQTLATATGRSGGHPAPPSGFTCSSLFGEWVDVRVGDGQVFGSPFQLLVKYASGTPKGFLHVVDGGGQELIKACPGTNPASGAPCFTWHGGSKTATIHLRQNGGMKGFN